MLSKLSLLVEKKPRLIIAIIIFITLIFASFIPSLKFGTSTRDFMPKNKVVEASDRINEYFGKNKEPVMIVLYNNLNAHSIKEENKLVKKLKEIDGIDDVVSIINFLSPICGMEYQKNLEECKENEIKNAYEDLMANRSIIRSYDEEKDARYSFADITSFEMMYDNKNLNLSIGINDAENIRKNVEWYVSFKNMIDPAKLNLTYIIALRYSMPQWKIGYGLKNNVESFKREIKAYLWIGKNGRFSDFPLNASINLEKNELKIIIPRNELGRYGIAPSFGNASLPAKLYDIEVGSRITMPIPISIKTSIIESLLHLIERSFLSHLIQKFLPQNQSIEYLQKFIGGKEAISLNDFNLTWKKVDELKVDGVFLIKQPFMDDLKNSALMFISKNANLMIAYLNGSLSSNEMKEKSRKIVYIVNKFAKENGFKADITGSTVISYQIDDLTGKSNKIIMPSIFIAIILILFINFRKISYVAISLTGLSFAIIWLFGTMALVGIKFNTIAIALVPLLLGLGVDYSVHIFHNYLQEIRKGKSVNEAISVSIREIGMALVLATITTAISFLSFLTASVPSVRNFGILSAIGIFYTFIIAITFEAALRYILDKNKKVEAKKSGSKFSAGNIMGKLSDTLCKNPIKVLAIIFSITLLLGVAAVNVKTSFSLEEFMPKESKAIKTMEKLPKYFPSASEDQEYILIEGNVASLDTIKGIKETMEKLKDDKYIAHYPNGKIKAYSLYSLMQDAIEDNSSLINKFNIGDEGIPKDENSLISFYNYLYESKKYGRDAKTILHKNGSKYDATVIRIYTTLTHLENSNEVMKRLYDDLKGDVSKYGDAKATITGNMVLIYTTMNSLTQSQISSTLICILIAAVVVMLAYRKFLLGLFTMMPVLLSSIWIMGTIYIAGYTLNVMTVMITSLTIGLGITYAIHVVERFRLVADKTGDVIKAVEEAVANTGAAVIMAALTTIAGFIVLIASPMPPEQQFGFITATTIAYSFITTVLVIPPLLLLWGKWRKRKYGYIISSGEQE